MFGFSPPLTQCADKDLVERLAGLKQLPETGQLFSRTQWQQEISSYRTWDGDHDLDDRKAEGKEANVSLILLIFDIAVTVALKPIIWGFKLVICFFFNCILQKEERLPKQITDQLVWVPEYEAKNSVSRINIYRDTILRSLEVSHSRFQCS